MASRSHPIIIFLDRNGFLLYQDFLQSVWQFPFSEDLVRHLEVINRDQLVDIILSFVKTNKLVPTSVIIILSDSVVFQKDLSPIQPGQNPQEREAQEKEIQQFLENVPFEYFMAKIVGETRIVATNRELLETIMLPFKKIGCFVESVVPSFVYDGKIDFSQGLTPDTAKAVLRNQDLLKMGNMLISQKEVEVKKEPTDMSPPDSLKEKPKNTMKVVLIAVFVFLLIILAVVYFTMGNSNDTPSSSNTNSSQSPNVPVSALTPTIDVMPTKTIVASPSAILSDIKTTIVVNSQTEAVGNILKRRLEQLGLASVTLSVAAPTNPARSSILFSKSVDNETRRIVAEEIRKILIDVSVQESQSLEDLSISIVVGSAL